MTAPRQLTHTVGPTHGGVVFSKGALPGIKRLAIGQIKKGRCGNYYVNGETWDPEFDFVETGFQVPFSKINIFVGFITATQSEPE